MKKDDKEKRMSEIEDRKARLVKEEVLVKIIVSRFLRKDYSPPTFQRRG